MATKPSPFTLHVPDADIADLRDRLARSRFPDQAPGDAWAYGTDVAYLRELTDTGAPRSIGERRKLA
jgi:hypothetical protein